MIYEGTNGIQALDLFMRKLRMDEGKPFLNFLERIQKTVDEAKGNNAVQKLVPNLQNTLNRFHEIVSTLTKAAASDKILEAVSQATPLLEITGDIVSAWMLLWRANVAAKALEAKPKKKDVDFYNGQLKTAEFFISSVLPVTMGKMQSVAEMNGAIVEISEAGFGGL
jgi:hypothetical protein